MKEPLPGMLRGKVAIVTGAGRGLGKSYAIELARHGAKVVVNDLGTSTRGDGTNGDPAQIVVDEIEALGGEGIADNSDISSWKQAEQLVARAVETFGDLNVVVNNAGVGRRSPIHEMSEEDWEVVVGTHGRGHMAMTRFASRYWFDKFERLGAQIDGTLIHTTSRIVTQGWTGSINYAFSKGGISTLSLVAAHELAPLGVTSNAIAPTARTRIATSFFDDRERDDDFDERDPDNVAPFVAFLATNEGRKISGEVFEVRGEEVWRLRPAAPETVIRNSGRWTLDGLLDRYRELL